jgi:hypothetical protein
MLGLPRSTTWEINLGAERVCEAVAAATAEKPFFIGRNGTVELETLFYWFVNRRGPEPKPYPERIAVTMARNAGVWPATNASLDAWAASYADALGALNGLAAGWYEPYRNVEESLLDTFAPTAFKTPLRSLEPYYVEPAKRWTRALAGRTVAVVTSFGTTVERQVEMPDAAVKLWSSVAEPDTILPPTTTWRAVRTYYSPALATDGHAGWPAAVRSWQEAVDWTVERVKATGATVAIIGCGGLGMIIGARLRAAGMSAFVLGGATQVLFGIRGARWANHSVISGFWNKWWVWPDRAETPNAAVTVEGGCYWSPKTASAVAKIDSDAASVTDYETAEDE